jgi:hypothetical protein
MTDEISAEMRARLDNDPEYQRLLKLTPEELDIYNANARAAIENARAAKVHEKSRKAALKALKEIGL